MSYRRTRFARFFWILREFEGCCSLIVDECSSISSRRDLCNSEKMHRINILINCLPKFWRIFRGKHPLNITDVARTLRIILKILLSILLMKSTSLYLKICKHFQHGKKSTWKLQRRDEFIIIRILRIFQQKLIPGQRNSIVNPFGVRSLRSNSNERSH